MSISGNKKRFSAILTFFQPAGRKKPAIFSGLNNKKILTFTANAPAPAGGPAPLSMEKKCRSARLNTQQKAKKWLPSGSQKKTAVWVVAYPWCRMI